MAEGRSRGQVVGEGRRTGICVWICARMDSEQQGGCGGKDMGELHREARRLRRRGSSAGSFIYCV